MSVESLLPYVTVLHCQIFRQYWTCITNYPSFRAVINVLVENCERKLLLYTGHVMEARDNEEIVLQLTMKAAN